MKLNDIYKELLELTKNLGIAVRKEKGNFKSGFCTFNEQDYIILNRSSSLETMASVIANGLLKHKDKLYIKPAVRDYIEKESGNTSPNDSFQISINN